MPHFRSLPTDLMTLPEIEEELVYQTKRLYRLQKLQKLGKDVQPDLLNVEEREADLDIAMRMRRLRLEETSG